MPLNEPEIILDFFAGSGTTAQAVMELNAEDGGSRRFILVQLGESIDAKSEAYKAGFRDIAQITIERIKRAGENIKSRFSGTTIDTGFRVYSLDSSNYKSIDEPDELFQIDNIKPNRSSEDLLAEIMLKSARFTLDTPIEPLEVLGYHLYLLGTSTYVCIEGHISLEIAKALAEIIKSNKEEINSGTIGTIYLKDSIFNNDDSLKINVFNLFENYKIIPRCV